MRQNDRHAIAPATSQAKQMRPERQVVIQTVECRQKASRATCSIDLGDNDVLRPMG
jgi:hypothetical protein